mmetsp:Transcript_10320/g.11764  ORF Transcript_10320/g.11764 Transcript_10320/m.11764 type:complete len:304 (-) Transcript_10320:1593-2504(-)
MREDHLGEGLPGGVLAKQRCEAERLQHRQEGLDLGQGGAGAIFFALDDTTPGVQCRVHTGDGALWHGDVAQVHRLQNCRAGLDLAGVHRALGGGHDLTSTTVNGISVHDHIIDVESAATQRLLHEDTSQRHLHEGAHNGVLDLVQVLHTLGGVDDNVGLSIGGKTEAPDLPGLSDIPLEVVGEHAGALLHVHVLLEDSLVHRGAELIAQRLGVQVDTVVLVGRLANHVHASLLRDRFAERHHGLAEAEGGTLHVVLAEILQAHLQVKLTGSGNDVLTGRGGEALHQRVGLRETLQTFHKLGQI